MLRLEGEFMETLRSEVADEAALAPTEAGDFLAWFEGLRKTGPGQGDPLFPWLASHASKEELRWFFEQEAAGEIGRAPSELQSLMRISYAVFCLKKKNNSTTQQYTHIFTQHHHTHTLH